MAVEQDIAQKIMALARKTSEFHSFYLTQKLNSQQKSVLEGTIEQNFDDAVVELKVALSRMPADQLIDLVTTIVTNLPDVLSPEGDVFLNQLNAQLTEE